MFQQVYAEISRRIDVPLKKPEYYRLMWETFRFAGRAHLVTATAHGTPLGAMLHFTSGDEVIWLRGARLPREQTLASESSSSGDRWYARVSLGGAATTSGDSHRGVGSLQAWFRGARRGVRGDPIVGGGSDR